ncbi:pyridoxal phosphate-dependent aminotransferase [Pasteurellaceae bacterium 20609_3]|uniref:MalY/PatB family protein n=1 Tax=Spirabiliibacterium mucosae TaxID=28156 RepID=UPI001AADF2D2|nr:MalY/PatB family protein [Spirabiliibacterium mucosae]MBE2897980.1 pyridoxal phosphate-dependent aminotransferase [Spirabiliibacterium mucosae]
MHKPHFDTIIPRHNTFSAKWDSALARFGADITPLSVADMDFAAPPAVVAAVAQANNGIYGYTELGDDYFTVVANWLARRYNYKVRSSQIVFCPRIIQAVSLYLRFLTAPDDAVGIFTPSYSPIFNTITLNQRRVVECPLVYANHSYHIDDAALERCFAQVNTFILISPHNPTGLVWTAEQLARIAQLAEQYDVFVISDEVHADFCFGARHQVYARVSEYAAAHSMVCTSPAKTFNLAGLEIANVVIENEAIKVRLEAVLKQLGFHNPSYFSVQALYRAYQECDAWVDALVDYIAENRTLVARYFQQHLPQLHISHGQGTYLCWVDFSAMGLSLREFKTLMREKARVEFSWGDDFGHDCKHFFRMNLALPRAELERVLSQIKAALIA